MSKVASKMHTVMAVWACIDPLLNKGMFSCWAKKVLNSSPAMHSLPLDTSLHLGLLFSALLSEDVEHEAALQAAASSSTRSCAVMLMSSVAACNSVFAVFSSLCYFLLWLLQAMYMPCCTMEFLSEDISPCLEVSWLNLSLSPPLTAWQ